VGTGSREKKRVKQSHVCPNVLNPDLWAIFARTPIKPISATFVARAEPELSPMLSGIAAHCDPSL
jgi:hypothetical protein